MNRQTNLCPPLPGMEKIPLRQHFRSFQMDARNPCQVCFGAVALNASIVPLWAGFMAAFGGRAHTSNPVV